MEMVEQNISGVKLEKLRQDAKKKTKILRRLFPGLFILLAVVAILKNITLFAYIGEYEFESDVTQGALFILLRDLMMDFILVGTAFIFYFMLVWKKAYERFNLSFKNRFVLDTIRQLPGFSELRYNAGGGVSYQEVQELNLIPEGSSIFFESSDELSGILDGARFRACNVRAGTKGSGRSTMPRILFEGQILIFSMFDDRKISNGFVQVFSKKVLSKVKRKTAPLKIQTENQMFNKNFAVFAEDDENAFYILTPNVLERITEFEEAVNGQVYLSFSEKELYVTCSQFKNPFDACIDIPVKEQQQQIIKDTAILQSARDILIQIGARKE